MIKDFFISFRDNMAKKSKNPFLGIYLLVWLVRSWELVYTLLNFEKKHDLNFKINFIKTYYKENDFLISLALNILWAIALLLVTFILLNLSRLVVNLFEKNLTPWIYKISDRSSIVLKESYESLKNDYNDLEQKLDKEREAKVKLQKEIENLESKIEELYTRNLDNSVKPTNQTNDGTNKGDFSDEVNIMFVKLRNKGLVDIYLADILDLEKNEGWINTEIESEAIQYFAKLGLFQAIERDDTYVKYSVTQLGLNVARRARLHLD